MIQFENLRVGDTLILPPLRVPAQWHKTPFSYLKGVLVRLLEREKDQGHKCATAGTPSPAANTAFSIWTTATTPGSFDRSVPPV